MERKVDRAIREWYSREDHGVLLLRGSRRVGKTHSVRKFGRECYDSVLELNFETNPEYGRFFESDVSADSIFERMSFSFPEISFEGCLLFLDEIQSCRGISSILDSLVSDGRCDVVCTESVSSEITGDSSTLQIDHMEVVCMRPMDFEEFMWAMGFSHTQTDDVRRHICETIPFERFILDQLNNLFRRYLVIGGMPASVSAYARTRMYSESHDEFGRIMESLSGDIRRYTRGPIDCIRIRQCLDSIPHQISRDGNHSFLYSEISGRKGYGRREFGPAISWLEDSGVIDICHNLEVFSELLRIREDGNTFRVYLRDTGLLSYMLGPDIVMGIVNGDLSVGDWSLFENAVFETLAGNGFDVYHHRDSSNGMALDFVFRYGDHLAVMVIDRGVKRSCRMLKKVMGKEDVVSILLSDSNISVDGDGIIHCPLFGPCFFEPSRS